MEVRAYCRSRGCAHLPSSGGAPNKQLESEAAGACHSSFTGKWLRVNVEGKSVGGMFYWPFPSGGGVSVSGEWVYWGRPCVCDPTRTPSSRPASLPPGPVHAQRHFSLLRPNIFFFPTTKLPRLTWNVWQAAPSTCWPPPVGSTSLSRPLTISASNRRHFAWT